MAGKYFTKEDVRKMMTEKVKDYLDKGWIFNFHYMQVSNGYEFAAVTDGKDTVVVYFQPNKLNGASSLNIEKFTGSNNEYENIWLDQGRGEILETTQFIYKRETETYVIVNGYDREKRSEKRFERLHNRRYFKNKAISESMKEVISNYIKKQGIPGLKRFKVSDITYAQYLLGQNKYSLEIKSHRVYVFREGWDVVVF